MQRNGYYLFYYTFSIDSVLEFNFVFEIVLTYSCVQNIPHKAVSAKNNS